jgi:hypothetical protein
MPNAGAHKGYRMKRYGNLSGDSGVIAYELGTATIVVQFQGGDKYEYTEQSAGVAVVATMRRLAESGRGLSAFMAQHRPRYACKFS